MENLFVESMKKIQTKQMSKITFNNSLWGFLHLPLHKEVSVYDFWVLIFLSSLLVSHHCSRLGLQKKPCVHFISFAETQFYYFYGSRVTWVYDKFDSAEDT